MAGSSSASSSASSLRNDAAWATECRSCGRRGVAPSETVPRFSLENLLPPLTLPPRAKQPRSPGVLVVAPYGPAKRRDNDGEVGVAPSDLDLKRRPLWRGAWAVAGVGGFGGGLVWTAVGLVGCSMPKPRMSKLNVLENMVRDVG